MILDDIVAYKRRQIEKEKEIKSIEAYSINLQHMPIRDFKRALSKESISIISEIKKASPSKGIIKEDFDPVKIAKVYEEIDIDAVSVLTEKQFFKGKDEYIEIVKKVNSKPILRKDFIIDEYQIFQAKAIGADAVLLIASILENNIKKFYNLAKELGLYCLTEVHNEKELDSALSAGCDIVGINNRDLRDFTVDLKTTEKLIKHIPKDTIVVSESGIKTSEDIKYLRSLGVNAVLIGETFMRNIEDIQEVRDFILKAKGI
ncbi:indole-3-glycerol phosphate synthase TrpC [Clostridium magnum]|uniref:Indole-3-glycerol phosphate synthase n=1 Tax=Clostridium magnum DSM 2767 TaxID=1121326 RepID=A0A161YJU8_9CLOT|nr:indole-3-glycerol phosphate synthase TrpC [Clostridium magnum]KZL90762.1 indole-3-glycerol phosphate synthase [Clostridium magnum DSM 2767]SHJ47810.1 indole-3-glycerol phosphate synthase [Clostridium magnum DSM 2767]